jgi:hypothetical protein
MPQFLGAKPVFSHLLRADRLEKSPYFWWWRFLGLSDTYSNNNNHPLHEDFGEILINTENVYRAFRDWWGASDDNHALLFTEKSHYPTPKIMREGDHIGSLENSYPYAVVVVDIHLGLNKAKEQIAKALRSIDHYRDFDPISNEYTEQIVLAKPEGRFPIYKRYSSAKYKISANYDTIELKKMFLVYRAYKDNNIDSVAGFKRSRVFNLLDAVFSREFKNPIEERSLDNYFSMARDVVLSVENGMFPSLSRENIDAMERYARPLERFTRYRDIEFEFME